MLTCYGNSIPVASNVNGSEGYLPLVRESSVSKSLNSLIADYRIIFK